MIAQQVLDPLTGKPYLQPVQHGSDNGVVRNIVLSRDEFRGTPFIPNITYYFAVTAYNYTPQPNPVKSYESAPVAFSVVPELPQPGTRFAYGIGDTVQVKDIVGVNDAEVIPVVYNPTRQRGATYRLLFDSTSAGEFRWTFSDAGTGKIFYNKITDLSGKVPYGVSEAGFSLYVAAPRSGVKAVTNEKGEDVFGPESPDSNYAILSATGMLEGFKSQSRQTATNYELRFDGRGSYVVRNGIPPSIAHGVYRAPFSTWDLGRTAADTPRQVIAWVKWDRVPAGRNQWNVDSVKTIIGGVSYRVFEAITITDLDYPVAPGDSLGVYALRTTVNLMATNGLDSNCAVYQVLFQDKQGTGAIPPTGTKVTFSKYLRIQNGDVKLVAPTPAVVADPAIARLDVAAIKAFPNPCYGAAHPGSPPFIMFSHLPTHAIVRIFNLAGAYVRRLEKHDATTHFLHWDVRNESGKRVASGIYIVQVEMPELNTTKTLKVAVILEATD